MAESVPPPPPACPQLPQRDSYGDVWGGFVDHPPSDRSSVSHT